MNSHKTLSYDSNNINDYILSTESTLNSIIYGHTEAKLEILQYICRIIRNPDSTGTSFRYLWSPGIGKTTSERRYCACFRKTICFH